MCTATTCNVLLADTDAAVHLVERLIGDGFGVLKATTWHDALRLIEQMKPHVVVVGYHFDEMRADRLIQFLRDAPRRIGIVVVRGLPAGATDFNEEAVAESYRQLGADAYLPLRKTAPAAHAEAVELRSTLRDLCKRVAAPQRRDLP
jgi:CheY-like chemotaxis protein